MPRRSSRLAKKKRVNMNEDAMFYRATKTTKDDWTEVEDLDPVPVYRDKKMFRKKLPKKKAIKLPPKKKKRQVIDLTGDRDDEKLSVIERDEKQVDYYVESAQERADRIQNMDRKVLKADPQTNQISKRRRHLLFLNPGDGVLQRTIMSFLNNDPLPAWAVPFAKHLRYNRDKGRLIWVEDGAPRVLL